MIGCAYVSARDVDSMFPLPVRVEIGHGVGAPVLNAAAFVEQSERQGAELYAAVVSVVYKVMREATGAARSSGGMRTRRCHLCAESRDRLIRRPLASTALGPEL